MLKRLTSNTQSNILTRKVQRRNCHENKAPRHLPLVILLALPITLHAQFTFTTNNGAITIASYTGPGGAVVIPVETNGLPVTSIDIYAFQNRFNVTSVSIPEGVTNIGFGAFSSCSSLSSITIPASVKAIREQAFTSCSSLINVSIPSGVQSLETAVFYG